jgi:hypothetical protein
MFAKNGTGYGSKGLALAGTVLASHYIRIIKNIEDGIAGAAALNILHETIRQFDRHVPRHRSSLLPKKR